MAQARRAHARGDLPADRVAELNALGIVWDAKAEGRREMIEFLRAFHAEHGNIAVPHDVRAALTFTEEGKLVRPPGVDVSRWLGIQRTKRAAGQLTAAQIAELDALGMVWRTPSRTDPHWDRLFAQAQEYFAQHGHLRVSSSATTDSASVQLLYCWLRRVRGYRRQDKLSADRIAALDQIGMEWTEPDVRQHAWLDQLDQATRYRSEHGTWPSVSYRGGDARINKLARWLRHQRDLYRKGELTPERARLLTEAGYELPLKNDAT